MPNMLYVVGSPAGDVRDLTLRARRILKEVGTVAACDPAWARQLLGRLGLHPAVVTATEGAVVWEALDHGDVALLSREEMPGSSGADLALIQAAVERGIPVVPVPAPVLPVTALVVSGLPADSFCFLGQLPEETVARHGLLQLVASERRTLLATESVDRLAVTLADLYAAFGDRPLVFFGTAESQIDLIWRGTLAGAVEQGAPDLLPGRCAMVIGGARTEEPAWDESRLRADVAACLERGLRAKEISQQLSALSGWSRREIYRLAVELRRSPANDRKET